MRKKWRPHPAKPELPTAVFKKMRQAFRQPGPPDQPCPDPALVISLALGELEKSACQQVETHLLTCRQCLELFLDARLAQADAEAPAAAGFQATPLDLRDRGWQARLSGMLGRFLAPLGQPRKLIPALAVLSLVLLVLTVWERQPRSPLPPPLPEALQAPAVPTAPPVAEAPPLPRERPFSQALPEKGREAPPGQLPAPAQKKEVFLTALKTAPDPLHLALSTTPAGQTRLAYRAHQQVFALLLLQDPSGKISLLQAGTLKAGKTYYYPAQGGLPPAASGSAETTFLLVAPPGPVADLPGTLQLLEREGIGRIQEIFPNASIRSLSVKHP